jgi:RNA polymerase sigma-70 factor (ECF subfamily)
MSITNKLTNRKQYRLNTAKTLTRAKGSVDSKPMAETNEPVNMRALLAPEVDWLRAECRKINPKHGDDLFQDVVMRAIKYQNSFNPDQQNLQGWLYTIAKNQSKTIEAKIKKEAFRTQDNVFKFNSEDGDEGDVFEHSLPEHLWSSSAEEIYAAKIDDDRITAALESLDDQFKEVIRLNMIEGYSYAEISEMLNIPTNTVGSRISRGREKLRELLGDVAEDYGINTDKKKK